MEEEGAQKENKHSEINAFLMRVYCCLSVGLSPELCCSLLSNQSLNLEQY